MAEILTREKMIARMLETIQKEMIASEDQGRNLTKPNSVKEEMEKTGMSEEACLAASGAYIRGRMDGLGPWVDLVQEFGKSALYHTK